MLYLKSEHKICMKLVYNSRSGNSLYCNILFTALWAKRSYRKKTEREGWIRFNLSMSKLYCTKSIISSLKVWKHFNTSWNVCKSHINQSGKISLKIANRIFKHNYTFDIFLIEIQFAGFVNLKFPLNVYDIHLRWF